MNKNVKPVLLMFALSNMAALIYQVSWTKSLSYVFGTSVYAVGTVLACFMAGLALGSLVFGKKADRSPNPVRLFAFVEVGAGILALLLIPVFALLPQPYALLHGMLEGTSLLRFVLFALSFQILIIPTSLIGGTFPIMNRIYASSVKKIGKDVGTVYTVDTIFAAIGALAAGFILLPLIGISKTIALAASINILAGLYLYRESATAHANAENHEHKNGSNLPTVNLVFIAFFLSGFAALAAEVVWIRFLSLTLGTGIYALSIITASFLIGLSLGSYVIRKYADRMKFPLATFAFIELGIGLSGILVFLLLDKLDLPYLLLYHAFDSFYPFTASLFGIIFLVMLIPTTLMGATMPVVGRIVTSRLEYIGTDIGAVYTVNTFGAIFGTFLASFVLIPAVGMAKTAAIIAAISISIAFMLFTRSERTWKTGFYSAAGVSIVLSLYLASATIHPLFAGAYYHGTRLNDIESWEDLKSRTEVVYYKEGLYGMVSVVKKDDYVALRIDGKSESSNVPVELVSEHQLAYIPMFAGRNTKDVMLIGLGGGFTLDAITNFEKVDAIDVVEINPDVVDAAKEYFSSYNNNALYDTRVNVVIDDGRNHLAASEKKYDVIISQPSNIWLSGEGGLFTNGMYEIVKAHLNDGGIFGQWMPLYEQSDEDFRIFLATFGSVFPYKDLWIVGYDAVLVGSMQPIEYDYGKIRSYLDSNLIRRDFEAMSSVLVTEGRYRLLYQVMVPYRMSGGDINEFSGSTINTDDSPVLEFTTARNAIYQKSAEKPFDAVWEFLEKKYALLLSLPFTNLTSGDKLGFIDLELGLDGWKEEDASINVDHKRNFIFMEAAYANNASRLSILAFPLPDQPFTGMRENIVQGMTASAAEVREVKINGHDGFEVESAGNYAVSWFCDHNDILYSIELKGNKGREIIERAACVH